MKPITAFGNQGRMKPITALGNQGRMKAIALKARRAEPLPEWALRQRHLIAAMNEAAPLFQRRYTRADGTYVWRDAFPGMDGSDDGYESYHNWPLFYALGGSADLHERSRFLWEAVTRQFTAYGQVHREFDAGYDWMHHGESSIYFYYFGLADPGRRRDRDRALRFAGLYMGDDPEAPNWDPEKRMIRSPINGSRGPRPAYSWEDWSTIRDVLSNYPLPFEDLEVPTRLIDWEGESVPGADWCDDAVYARILDALNHRQMGADVPLNLTATSLAANAFLYTGDERYRTWVLDYLQAWAERIEANGGICPDNVGAGGRIGENMGGRWWGGYYGWAWPHGLRTVIEPLSIAAMNAALLSGDLGYLDIPRGQLRRLLDLGRVEDGRYLVPCRHTDSGWTSFRPPEPHYLGQLWYMSQAREDRLLIEQLPQSRTSWRRIEPGRGKGDDIHFAPWFCYLDGRLDDYPARILEAQYAEVGRRMDLMRRDGGDPARWDVHHWQDVNPVHTEALVQLTCGGPQIIYHGGLLHVRLRYYDASERRPGLPPHTAALVSALDAHGATLHLANLSPLRRQDLVLQAGAFGEHSFTEVVEEGVRGAQPQAVDGKWLALTLEPGCSATLRLGMRRYCRSPSYDQPW